MASISDIKKGFTLRFNGDIYAVVDFQRVLVARGSAFIRTKIKSLTTGKMIETTFNSSATLDEVPVQRKKFQFLYDEGDSLVFMANDDYEQVSVNKEMIDGIDLLIEGDLCDVVFNLDDNQPLSVEMPQFVVREVTYTEPGMKGDSATNTLKPATVNTGAEIRVPLFVNVGDKIKIDTATRSYIERAKD